MVHDLPVSPPSSQYFLSHHKSIIIQNTHSQPSSHPVLPVLFSTSEVHCMVWCSHCGLIINEAEGFQNTFKIHNKGLNLAVRAISVHLAGFLSLVNICSQMQKGYKNILSLRAHTFHLLWKGFVSRSIYWCINSSFCSIKSKTVGWL
jgi:hypothetical protein